MAAIARECRRGHLPAAVRGQSRWKQQAALRGRPAVHGSALSCVSVISDEQVRGVYRERGESCFVGAWAPHVIRVM